jgi:dolichol-phosphate mannosyltransferase
MLRAHLPRRGSGTTIATFEALRDWLIGQRVNNGEGEFAHPNRRQPAVRHSNTLIFLPTYNERDTIKPIVEALLAIRNECDVLVIEDRSTDGTGEILKSLAAANPRLAVIFRPGKLGIGSAHGLGWLHARQQGYRRIASLDADLSHDPADVARLLAMLDAGADVAFGSRFAPGGRLDYRGWRLVLSWTANHLARAVLRLPITDYTNSLRAAWLDRVPQGLVETIENDGYGFFLISAVELVRAGLKIAEVPIHFRDRDHGASKIPRFEVLRGAFNLARLAFTAKRARQAMPEDVGSECPACRGPYLVGDANGGARCLTCNLITPAAARRRAA